MQVIVSAFGTETSSYLISLVQKVSKKLKYIRKALINIFNNSGIGLGTLGGDTTRGDKVLIDATAKQAQATTASYASRWGK